MTDDDQPIRELAYRIWEEEGRPEGLADQHWAMAQRMLGKTAPEAEATPHGTTDATAGQKGQTGSPGSQTGRPQDAKADPPKPKSSK
jgi:hypothetical protein